MIRLRVHLLLGVEPVAEARCAYRSQEDVVKVPKGRFREKFLCHFGFVEDLLVHLSRRHPEVAHLNALEFFELFI
jgi:hypothetical protein